MNPSGGSRASPASSRAASSSLAIPSFPTASKTAARYLVGRLLDYWGLKSLADLINGKPDTQVIIEILQDLNKKVTKLQETVESTKLAVAESQYSLLVRDMTRDWTVPIDAISLELKAVAEAPKPKTPAEDAARVQYAREVVGHIKKNLVDKFAAMQMHQALDTPVPAANDILKAASQIYGARRWFTAQSSANINAIYEYFAVYQLRLAILLTNYEATVRGLQRRAGAGADQGHRREHHQTEDGTSQAAGSGRQVRRHPQHAALGPETGVGARPGLQADRAVH